MSAGEATVSVTNPRPSSPFVIAPLYHVAMVYVADGKCVNLSTHTSLYASLIILLNRPASPSSRA